MSKDYYAILGVAKNASDQEIKKAYRRLAHEHHPDKGGDQQKFKDINEAYQVLGDAQKRGAYDRFGSAAFEQGGMGGGGSAGGFGGFDFRGFEGAEDLGDLGDVLGQVFGFGGGGRERAARGKDIQVEMELTFREAAFGVERPLRLYKHGVCSRCKGDGAEPGSKIVNCSTCQGTGQVRQAQRTPFGTIQIATSCSTCHGRGKKSEKECHLCRGLGVERREEKVALQIPPGVNDGETLKVAGQGEAAPYGARAGDLYIRLRVKSDPTFDREGYDVLSSVEVPYSVLTLGGTVKVDTLDGATSLKISEHTPPGTVFTLRHQGIKRGHSGARGDHRVEVTAHVPQKLTREQKKILEELRAQGL